MKHSLKVGVPLAAAAFMFTTQAYGQQIDQSYYYRLSTEFLGTGMSLDAINGGPENNETRLERTQDVSGQYWRFTGAEGGYYRLSTLFRGRQMCLDIFNGGPKNNQPYLTRCQNVTGQLWRTRQDGRWRRLTTKFRGEAVCLDIFNGGASDRKPHLTNCADLTGQRWAVDRTTKRVDGAVSID